MTVKSMTLAEIQALEAQHIVPVYRRTAVAFERGEGARIFGPDGREYVDLISGIGVASLGHAHAGLADALDAQARTLIHCSNLFYHSLQGQVAQRLATLSGLPRAFLCNSGTEAVEACLKFARRYWHTRGGPRPDFVALAGAFHGRTFGALSVTADPHYRDPFAPLLSNVRFVSRDVPTELQSAVSLSTAAIIVEPIQGEGGVHPLTRAFADAINEACLRTGALLIADEVQCGLGRTGHPFYSGQLGLRPHLVAVGKALGGGVPIGAALVNDAVGRSLSFGDHGSTYGGNLLACRAALVFLQELMEGGLIERVQRLGERVRAALEDLRRRHPAIVDIRGAGLMWGIELNADATPVVEAAVQHGLLINRTAGTVIRLLPPLVIEERELDLGLALLDAALRDVFSGVAA